MELITTAARASKTVTISYTDSKHKTTYRECEPYEITGDGVYMVDVAKGEIRLFKLSNINNVTINPTVFSPRFPIKI